MSFLSSMNIAASGMTAQQLRLDVVSENITNSTTTRTENGEGPYRRKVVVFEAVAGRETFQEAMARANGKLSNENVVKRAPAELVESEQARQADLMDKKAKMQALQIRFKEAMGE